MYFLILTGADGSIQMSDDFYKQALESLEAQRENTKDPRRIAEIISKMEKIKKIMNKD